jgi:hypothetical protein
MIVVELLLGAAALAAVPAGPRLALSVARLPAVRRVTEEPERQRAPRLR